MHIHTHCQKAWCFIFALFCLRGEGWQQEAVIRRLLPVIDALLRNPKASNSLYFLHRLPTQDEVPIESSY